MNFKEYLFGMWVLGEGRVCGVEGVIHESSLRRTCLFHSIVDEDEKSTTLCEH
jgi:hypothetical protein